MHTCGAYWDNYDDLVKEVTNQIISYALDLVHPTIKSKWPMIASDQVAFAESKMGCKKQHQGKQDVVLMQIVTPDVVILAM